MAALKEARGAINVDNVQEAHDKLESFAQSTDSAAATMLSNSVAQLGASNP